MVNEDANEICNKAENSIAVGIDRYAVIGNPVKHSQSPIIHAAFAKQTGQMLTYERLLSDKDRFQETVDQFRAQGGKGANVTLPFKVEALHYADNVTERAQLAGAANTLKFDEDQCLADNTDGVGLLHDLLQNLQWEIKDRKILILGAGGAARGIVLPLLQQHPASITIANRTVGKAEELVKAFTALGSVSSTSLTRLNQSFFDIIINATSASLRNEMPPIAHSVLHENTACYDIVYGEKPSIFMQWAHRYGCKNISDGLGMLVEQAAESFYLWRNIRPFTPPVIAMLRSQQ